MFTWQVSSNAKRQVSLHPKKNNLRRNKVLFEVFFFSTCFWSKVFWTWKEKTELNVFIYIPHAGTLRPGSLTEAWKIDFFCDEEFLFFFAHVPLIFWEVGIHTDYALTTGNTKCRVKLIDVTHELFHLLKFLKEYYYNHLLPLCDTVQHLDVDSQWWN